MNLKLIAARVGYGIYLGTSPRPSLVELNDALAEKHLPPVKDRTLDHYGRMERHGVSAYMPINEFDQAVKHGRLRPAA